MAVANSSIEWTESTWSPLTGCTKVSPGCDHCYAETLHERFNGKGSFATVTLRPERLDQPLRWRRPRRIFVNSMSDLFHDAVPDEYIARVFAVMAEAGRHTFQLLTKRHGRMRSLLSDPDWRFQGMVGAARYDLGNHSEAPLSPGNEDPSFGWPLPNLWLGVSVEDQKWADIRIPALLDTPAAVRWISAEPLLGPINLIGVVGQGCECAGPAITHSGYSTRTDYGTGVEYDCEHEVGLDWVVCGGESGRGARPMHPDWARSLRDQCVNAGVPFLFKQWGKHVVEDQSPIDIVLPGMCSHLLGNSGPCFYKVGKKAAGRELDGRTWDEYPSVVRSA